jgi:nitric oxide reductase large subunit
MTFRQSAVVTTAIIGLSAITAAAAPPGAKDPITPPGTPPAAQAQAEAQQSGTASQHSMEASVNQRIKELHAKLHITAAQEQAWQQFAQTMRDNAQKMDQAFESRVDQMQSMTALDNMKSYAQISQQHAADVQSLLPPFEALYGSMSESQKHTADQVFREDANRGAPAQPGRG